MTECQFCIDDEDYDGDPSDTPAEVTSMDDICSEHVVWVSDQHQHGETWSFRPVDALVAAARDAVKQSGTWKTAECMKAIGTLPEATASYLIDCLHECAPDGTEPDETEREDDEDDDEDDEESYSDEDEGSDPWFDAQEALYLNLIGVTDVEVLDDSVEWIGWVCDNPGSTSYMLAKDPVELSTQLETRLKPVLEAIHAAGEQGQLFES